MKDALLCFSTALLYMLSFPRWNFAGAAFLCLAPLIVSIVDGRKRFRATRGFLTALASNILYTSWIVIPARLGGWPWPRSFHAQMIENLKKHGAKEFYLAATHAVFSGPAIERLKKADFKQIVVTNTIPLGDKKFDKIKVISTAPLLAEAILRNNSHESVSELFK
jgi:hypothetical protein